MILILIVPVRAVSDRAGSRGCALVIGLLVVTHPALGQPGDQIAHHRYDIPALPLDEALARFAQVSGIAVLRRDLGSAPRRSHPVQGDLTPMEALSVMVRGSGLVVRFTSPRSAILIPADRANDPWIEAPTGRAGGSALLNLDMLNVTAPRLIGRRSGAIEAQRVFAQQLGYRISRHLTQYGKADGPTFAGLRVSTRIDGAGILHDVRVVRSGGSAANDRDLAALLEGTSLGLKPPEGVRQPLLFDLAGQ